MLDLPWSSPYVQGYWSEQIPHAINHVLVADLGEKEVVLCACDDGDVLGYYTSHVNYALEYGAGAGRRDPYHLVDVRPFFHVNVGASAWGLAVHEEARMIAISSNTQDVNVYAFALEKKLSDSKRVEDYGTFTRYSQSTSSSGVSWNEANEYSSGDSHDHDLSDFWQCYSAQDHLHLLRARTRNWCIRLRSHETNIPCVAFCNTGDDPKGKYLMSGDIFGGVRLWDIEDAAPCKLLRPPARNVNRIVHDWAIWGLHWIDRRAFRKTPHPTIALQFCTLWKEQRRCLVDISVNRDMVKDSGAWVVGQGRQRTNRRVDEASLQQDAEPLAAFEPEDGDDNLLEGSGDSDEDNSEMPEGSTLGRAPPVLHSRPRNIQLDPINWYVDLTRRGQWPTRTYQPGECVDRDLYKGSALYVRGLSGILEEDANEPADPILMTNPRNITLFQRSASMSRIASGPQAPTIWIEEPLKQEMPDMWLPRFQAWDQIKLTLQIPELGVILAGSGAGRVAVMSLHQLHPNPFCLEDPRQPVYTMRLDHILPRQSQEVRGERPVFPLVGLTASPVQGMESAEGGQGKGGGGVRRWRILMLYVEGTMLSYELTRRSRDPAARAAQEEELLVI